jgi:hypothetical protein
MIPGMTTIERAFQLAASGSVDSISALKKKLNSEGFTADQIMGRELSRQLTKIILANKPKSIEPDGEEPEHPETSERVQS